MINRVGGIKMEFVYFMLAVVIIGAIGYGVAYFLSQKQSKELEEINVKKQKMMAVPITETLFTLKNLNLTGQTKRSYESWQATWQTITRFRFPEIEATIVSAEQYIEKLNFIKAAQLTKQINELIDEAKKDIDKIFNALQKLLDSEKQNRDVLEMLQERYSTLRKDLLAHGFSFGNALESLEKRLSYLELDFTKFNTLTHEGDHLEAREILTRIEAEMGEFEEIIDLVPKFYKEIETEQMEQIEDLKDGYARMKAENYPFGKVDVETKISEIEAIVSEAKECIATTKLDDARKHMDKANREIDTLYSIMETELAAKTYVNAHQYRIEQGVQRSMDNNRYVLLEIDRVSQNYILSNNELAQVQEYDEQLKKEQESVNYYKEAMKNHTVPFSQIQEFYELTQSKLEEIEQNQSSLVEKLSGLRQQEKGIRDSLDVYELDLRNMKRTIEKYHLPGLPKEYLELFFTTGHRIEQLSQKLNRVKIDMKEIEQLNTRIEEDVEQLDILTEQIVDHAQLTEYMIQHANRYRLSHPEIEQAIETALTKFNELYQFTEALEMIESALETVEPGAGEKVRLIYDQEKKNPVF